MEAIKEFEVDTKACSQKEKAVFKKLISAAKLIAPLYLKQKNPKYPGANFYPPDATKEEIKEAAKKDPLILDPYTLVERDKSGSLKAVSFHIKFKKELEPVAELLREAAGLSEDENFSYYLKSRAQSLLDGNYEKSEIVWLTSGAFDSKFGFVIGPIERYIDKLFFTKCAYQAWVGIIDEKRTREAERTKEMIVSSRERILPGSEKVGLPELRIRIDRTALFTGLIADFLFTGTNLPNDVNLMKKYGSNLTIFETSLESKFQEDHFPIFETVFNKKFQKPYSREKLYEGSLACILSHEISHSLIRYRDAEERLSNLFPIFDELLAYILGIRSYSSLFLKGAVTQKELETILIMHICRNFTWWLDSIKNPDVMHYAIGAAIATNFFLREGGLREKRGISWPNFTKLLICIDELSRILEYYLALGNYNEAKKFVDKYDSFKVFEPSVPKLKKIKEIKKS